MKEQQRESGGANRDDAVRLPALLAIEMLAAVECAVLVVELSFRLPQCD